MINLNARRTGTAGVIARAIGTLGAATLLLTSTGWGALAGDTGYGAVNLKAYMGAAAAAMAPGGSSSQSAIDNLSASIAANQAAASSMHALAQALMSNPYTAAAGAAMEASATAIDAQVAAAKAQLANLQAQLAKASK